MIARTLIHGLAQRTLAHGESLSMIGKLGRSYFDMTSRCAHLPRDSIVVTSTVGVTAPRRLDGGGGQIS